MKKIKEKLQQTNTQFPLYIFFFPWYSILFLYSNNYIKLAFGVVLKPFLITTLICLFLWAVFKLIFKIGNKAGVLVGTLLLTAFMYGPLRKITFFNSFNVGALQLRWDYFYLFFTAALLVSVIVFLVKSKRSLSNLTKIANIGGTVLLLLVLIPLIFSYTKIHLEEAGESSGPDVSQEVVLTGNNDDQAVTSKPDIYYIIPDDYGSPDIQSEDYNFDDSELTSFLQSKGFYIANQSKTNYPYSQFMVTSALNMDYLTPQNYPAIKKEPGGTVIDNAFNHPKAVSLLKSEGYSFFNIGSWFEPFRYNDSADINFTFDNKLNLDEFSNTLLQNTIFYPLVLRYFSLSGLSNQIVNTSYQYQALKNMPNQISPKFVFVDVLSPHTPYIYDQNCKVVLNQSKNPIINRFTNQVSCVNKNLISTINSILNNSKTPPVIILQTDEGAKDNNNLALKYPNPTGVSGGFENSSTETDLERTKILSAFYFPDKNYQLLYPSITPVNTLRVVFNKYFNSKLPILPDKIYTFDDYDKLYKFIFNDITAQVEGK